MNHIPYTYLIKFTNPSSNEILFYYGVQYGKTANPSNLFKTYFTNSKKIKQLIKKYGLKCFSYEIRNRFPNEPYKALKWEQKVIRRLKMHQRHDFLNMGLGGKCYFLYGNDNPSKREDVKEKISQSLKRWFENNENPFKGKTHTEETKNIIGSKNKGKIHSTETRLKMSISKKGKPRTEETKQKMSIRMSGNKNHMYGKTGNWNHINNDAVSCPHCGLTSTIGNIKRWHLDNCKIKPKI
jgi:hypothetical protein